MNFIEEYFINPSLCDELVKYFESYSTPKLPGLSNDGVYINIKESTDTSLCEPLRSVYLIELQNCVEKYKQKYQMCDRAFDSWSVIENINIQKYNPGQWYKKWHCERDSPKSHNLRRILVFMTYLNTVDDEGETEFLYQNMKVKPEKGKTLIWPAEWTHTHKGIPSRTETKYIVTGWFSFDNLCPQGT